MRKLDFDEYLANINTTLTPEQKEYVDKIKHQYKGAAARPCKFRVAHLRCVSYAITRENNVLTLILACSSVP